MIGEITDENDRSIKDSSHEREEPWEGVWTVLDNDEDNDDRDNPDGKKSGHLDDTDNTNDDDSGNNGSSSKLSTTAKIPGRA